VHILGDVPFYVSGGSADVQAHPELFLSDAIAGVPPDDFSADGQLWGNPPYDWPAIAAQGYRWWIERLRRVARLADATRIDHFRGFASWWAVPPGSVTAREGEWRPGPGDALFERVRAAVPSLGLVAEDLGLITPDVVEMLTRLGLPGIRVMQYAFGGGHDNPHRIDDHPERAMVVTGTHDNDTIAGWWGSSPEPVRRAVVEQAVGWGVDDREPHRMLIGLAHASRAALAVVPLQDVLGLGPEARTNTPGTSAGNWAWRVDADALTRGAADWLRSVTEAAARLPALPGR
jgi:4-alpha-glucanotransferase